MSSRGTETDQPRWSKYSLRLLDVTRWAATLYMVYEAFQLFQASFLGLVGSNKRPNIGYLLGLPFTYSKAMATLCVGDTLSRRPVYPVSLGVLPVLGPLLSSTVNQILSGGPLGPLLSVFKVVLVKANPRYDLISLLIGVGGGLMALLRYPNAVWSLAMRLSRGRVTRHTSKEHLLRDLKMSVMNYVEVACSIVLCRSMLISIGVPILESTAGYVAQVCAFLSGSTSVAVRISLLVLYFKRDITPVLQYLLNPNSILIVTPMVLSVVGPNYILSLYERLLMRGAYSFFRFKRVLPSGIIPYSGRLLSVGYTLLSYLVDGYDRMGMIEWSRVSPVFPFLWMYRKYFELTLLSGFLQKLLGYRLPFARYRLYPSSDATRLTWSAVSWAWLMELRGKSYSKYLWRVFRSFMSREHLGDSGSVLFNILDLHPVIPHGNVGYFLGILVLGMLVSSMDRQDFDAFKLEYYPSYCSARRVEFHGVRYLGQAVVLSYVDWADVSKGLTPLTSLGRVYSYLIDRSPGARFLKSFIGSWYMVPLTLIVSTTLHVWYLYLGNSLVRSFYEYMYPDLEKPKVISSSEDLTLP